MLVQIIIKLEKKEFTQGKLTGKAPQVKSKEEEELIRLRKELTDVKLERDILKKAVASSSRATNKISILQSYKYEFPVRKMCLVFIVCKKGYYK
jgi:hypothetical protein